jgi:CheY-like chemotaxis protein
MRQATRPRLVMVVDDDEMVRRLIRVVLETDEFEVAEADPAIVVLDIMMPGLDGVEVCRRLDHERSKVVILTARDDPRLEEECRRVGADAFLTKPFSSIDLLDLISGLLPA